MRAIVLLALFGLALHASAQSCPAALMGGANQYASWQWTQKDQGTIAATLCGYMTTTCGTDPNENKCYQSSSNCCVACQSWNTQGNPGGACLGATLQGAVPGSSNYVLQYVNGDVDSQSGIGRQVYITVTCGSGTLAITDFVEASSKDPPPHGQPYTYTMAMNTAAICGAVGGGKGGMVFVILLIVCFAVYFIVFALLNKFKNGAEGMDIIPHREFWADTPSMFMDGFNFVKGKIMGLFGREGYSSVN